MDGLGSQPPPDDSQLDRELGAALGIEPSPEFVARVRTRIASEPEPLRWRRTLVVSGFSRAFEPLMAVAIVGVVVAVVIPTFMRGDDVRRPAVTTMAGDASRHVVRQRPSAREVTPIGLSATRRARRAVATAMNELPLRLSQPVFSDDDRRVYLQFIAAVGDGRVPPATEPAAAAHDDAASSAALRIEPLAIDPLPQLARVQKEGDGQW
jgi:hypothetical protein